MADDAFKIEIPHLREVLAAKVKRTQSTRAFLRDFVVTVEGDSVVTYTGEQLDVNDWRVFDELVRRVDGQFNTPCTKTCQEICLSLGLTSFEALQQIAARLQTGSICIQNKTKITAFHMISSFAWNSDERIEYIITEEIGKYFIS